MINKNPTGNENTSHGEIELKNIIFFFKKKSGINWRSSITMFPREKEIS